MLLAICVFSPCGCRPEDHQGRSENRHGRGSAHWQGNLVTEPPSHVPARLVDAPLGAPHPRPRVRRAKQGVAACLAAQAPAKFRGAVTAVRAVEGIPFIS